MRMISMVFCTTCLLSACSSFDFHSNLDKSNFTEYFKPSTVTVSTKEDILKANSTSLGTVEGESCQEKPNSTPPQEAAAQTDARRKVADMGGNAVTFDKCVSLPADKYCTASLVCYGQAYKVKTDK